MATEVNLSDTQTELQKDGETDEEKGDKSKFEDIADDNNSDGENEESKDSNPEEENEQGSNGDLDEEDRTKALRENELSEGEDRDNSGNPEGDEVSNQSEGVVHAVVSVVEEAKGKNDEE